ncbi:sn-1-specific diacylglycerol lipase ABHD11-like [Lycorma delicatula]|uniref:sn-1-specific diacylglycerol lipase ABHD11-like n=1 Tax=Lycorma delicatula TaxID=130591 RepID=UPI003F50F84B
MLFKIVYAFFFFLFVFCVSGLKPMRKKNVKPIHMAYTLLQEEMPKIEDRVPVIIMHGLLGSKNNWNSLGDAIHKETDKKVYLVDARNHGDSPHTYEHTYYHLAEDINAFMNKHKIERAALIGHSMGGRAVMAFTLFYPEKVESMIIVDISPIGTAKSFTNMTVILDALKNIKLKKELNLPEGRKSVTKQLTESVNDKKMSTFLSMSLVKKKNGMFDWKFNLNAIRNSYIPHMTKFPIQQGLYRGPVLFVCGEESDFFDFNDVKKVEKIFPDAYFVKIEKAGHWVQADQPKRFLYIVNPFLMQKATQQQFYYATPKY